MHIAQAKILIVENNSAVRNLIYCYLRQKNYILQFAADIQTALKVFKQFEPHLVILAINLPDGSGYDLCEQINNRTNAFILILSSRSDAEDKKEGFLRGADDYLAKPFDLQELECRIKAILKRHQKISTLETFLKIGDIAVDSVHKEVSINNEPIPLTNLEFNLFYFLAAQPGRVWRRSELIKNIWNHDYVRNEKIVDVHIGQIRKKIVKANSSNIFCIQTIRSVGYRLNVEAS